MADLNLGTYSPEDMVAVISVGETSHVISGFAEGTFLTIDREMPSSQFVMGAQRAGGRIFRSNNSGSISLTLLQFSASNDVLSAIWKEDATRRDNTMLFNMTVKDGTGRSVFYARQCYIENLASAGFGTEEESRTWVIRANELEQYIGGNATLPPDVVQTLTALGIVVEDRWL